MLSNPNVKNILSALAVAVFGYVLLGLTFLLDFLFHSLVERLIRLFTPVDFNMTYNWFPPMMHALFLVIICLISWPVFRSKLGTLYKAIYMTVPVAVILATIGIFLYNWPVVPYVVGSLFAVGVLFYLYHTKQPWLYYYTLILVALSITIFTLLGGEI
jgi:cation transport ATPase